MSEFIKGWKGKNKRNDDCEIVADNLTGQTHPLLVICIKPTTKMVTYYQADIEGKNDSSFYTNGYELVSNRHPALDWSINTKVLAYNDHNSSKKRCYFSHAIQKNGEIEFYCFVDGSTSWSANTWNDPPVTRWCFVELYEEEGQ